MATHDSAVDFDRLAAAARAEAPTLTVVPPRCHDIAAELRQVVRRAGRNPESLEGRLPGLCAFARVASAGVIDEASRVHVVLHRLIPEYLERLPSGPNCRAIRELLRWEDTDGELQSLTTRYHNAAKHLYRPAGDFGRRQEPRLLHECARRFIVFDQDDRFGASPGPDADPSSPSLAAVHAPLAAPDSALLPGDRLGGIVAAHPNLDYHMLAAAIAGGDEIVMFNTWIPGLDIIADSLVEALARGAHVSILLLHPDSNIARLRSLALQDGKQQGYHEDRVMRGIRHCLEVLAAVAHDVDADARRNLRVRLYDSLPSLAVYGIDNRAFLGFLLHGQLAVSCPQIELIGRDSILARLAFGEIDTVWDAAQDVADLGRGQAAPRRYLGNAQSASREGRAAEVALV